MKTVIVGGSSHSTPALFDGNRSFAAGPYRFDFVGRSMHRLRAVERASRLVSARRGYELDCRSVGWDDMDCALEDADVVLVQFRCGGYGARAWDESFPHRYEMCGDEGLGPGGLAAAWRTWPQLERVLARVARISPRAIVVLLTSPIGILTRAAKNAFSALRIYGICELPWVTLREINATQPFQLATTTFAYLAVNHLGWFTNVTTDGKQVLGADVVAPLKYVGLLDKPEATLAEQRARAPRAVALERLAAAAFTVYETGNADEVIAQLHHRPTPWYSEAVAPLLAALAGEPSDAIFFLTASNDGYCARFGAEEFLEIPHIVRNGQLERFPTLPWQNDGIATRMHSLVAYETRAAQAVRSQDVKLIATALQAHPALGSQPIPAGLAADVTGPIPVMLAR